MRRIIVAAILLCATTAVVARTSDSVPIFPNPYAPPAHVAHWIRIVWAGGMNHPIIPVFYTFERATSPEGSVSRYVTLTRPEYKSLSDFVHSYRCSRDNVSDKPPYPGSIAIYELERGEDRNLCILPSDPGCDFLFRLAALPGIDWSRKDTYPLYQFEAELGCKKPWTQSHDADGRPN